MIAQIGRIATGTNFASHPPPPRLITAVLDPLQPDSTIFVSLLPGRATQTKGTDMASIAFRLAF
jgi:hypothetical protein